MACRLVGAKPLSELMVEYCELWPENKFQWNLRRNSYTSSQGNVYGNVVWKMPVILSRPRWVQLSCVTPPRRVSLRRQVCHNCLPRDCHWESLRLGQRWPPCRRTYTSFWVLLTAFNVQIFLYRYALGYMYCYHYFMSLVVMSCDSVYWMRNLFGPNWSTKYYHY